MEQEKPKSLNPINSWGTVLIFCATLGLAPILPEPHVWGKLKWMAGGAVGMKLIDWGDFLMHGLPWIFLIRLVILTGKQKLSTTKS
ncbi:hypothetical protein [Algoriphagus mannitolivorans]|uniref:hypothetical protein n=1 Tax=Algoriphagus mannitolivorans TaxID=226504 RepID=UPI0005582550|nr:hypothetical protein [Algoriphagus mannitolivorans]